MVTNGLNDELERVILCVGDIIIDQLGDQVGILINRTRHVDMIEDDVYMWEVKWLTTVESVVDVPSANFLEEESLKFSIVIGMYEWHSIDGGTFEL